MSLDDIIKMNQQPGRGGRGGRRGRGRPFAFNRRNSNGEWRGVSRGGVRRRRDFRQPASFTRVSWRQTTITEDLGCLLVLGGVTIHRTGPAPGPYRAGNDWLFHFEDELKGVRRANYPQLTKEMNPSQRSWWVGDGRIHCFLLIQLKSEHRGFTVMT